MANQTNTQQYSQSQDLVFRQKVEIAMCNAAIAIQAEGAITNHTNRANYAKLVLNNPPSYGPLFAEALVTQPDPGSAGNNVTNNTTDANLLNVVSSVWNALAGTI